MKLFILLGEQPGDYGRYYPRCDALGIFDSLESAKTHWNALPIVAYTEDSEPLRAYLVASDIQYIDYQCYEVPYYKE